MVHTGTGRARDVPSRPSRRGVRRAYRHGVSTSAELGLPALTVSPGGEATTTLTIRNETDIVEAYALEVVGECAAWTTVQPARVSLYPGTSETVSIRLAPPRSPDVRTGEFPLGVKVLPAERPELVAVPETTVTVTAFHELRADLAPRRRRGWLRARYRTSVRNLGNTDADVAFAAGQAGEDLRFAFRPATVHLEPGETGEVRLRARTRRLIWFGKPATWTFEVQVSQAAAPDPAQRERHDPDPPVTSNGEFVQLSVFPKWLLAVLAAIIALLILWFALVRPAVRSSARQAAAKEVGKKVARLEPTGAAGTGASGGQGSGGQGAGSGGSGGTTGRPVPGTAVQSSATIDVQTAGGASKVGSYRVPSGKVFGITDIVVANFQGDQGLLTIKFGQQTITTIALETFRNQDYHWVTPIDVPADQTVTASVTCEKPGTPASGRTASECHELLNVSGELSDLKS